MDCSDYAWFILRLKKIHDAPRLRFEVERSRGFLDANPRFVDSSILEGTDAGVGVIPEYRLLGGESRDIRNPARIRCRQAQVGQERFPWRNRQGDAQVELLLGLMVARLAGRGGIGGHGGHCRSPAPWPVFPH